MSGVVNLTKAWADVYDPNLVVNAKIKGTQLANLETSIPEAIVNGYEKGQKLQENENIIKQGQQQIQENDIKIQQLPQRLEMDQQALDLRSKTADIEFQKAQVDLLADKFTTDYTHSQQTAETNAISSLADADDVTAFNMLTSPSFAYKIKTPSAQQAAQTKMLQLHDSEMLTDQQKEALNKIGQLGKKSSSSSKTEKPSVTSPSVTDTILSTTSDLAGKESTVTETTATEAPAAPNTPQPSNPVVGQTAEGAPIFNPQTNNPDVIGQEANGAPITKAPKYNTSSGVAKPSANPTLPPQSAISEDEMSDFFNLQTKEADFINKTPEFIKNDPTRMGQRLNNWYDKLDKNTDNNYKKVELLAKTTTPAQVAIKRNIDNLTKLKELSVNNPKLAAQFGPQIPVLGMSLEQLDNAIDASLFDGEDAREAIAIRDNIMANNLLIAKSRSAYTGQELNQKEEQIIAAAGVIPSNLGVDHALTAAKEVEKELQRNAARIDFGRTFARKLGHAENIDAIFEKYYTESDPTADGIEDPTSKKLLKNPDDRISPEEWIDNGRQAIRNHALQMKQEKIIQHQQSIGYNSELSTPEQRAAKVEKDTFYKLMANKKHPVEYQKRILGDADYQSNVHNISTQLVSHPKFAAIPFNKLPKVDLHSLEYTPEEAIRLVKRESNGVANAMGKDGEIGLTQMKPSTAAYVASLPYYKDIPLDDTGRKLGEVTQNEWKTLLLKPDLNLHMALMYLNGPLAEQFPGKRERAAAYNWGPGNMLKAKKFGTKIPASVVSYMDEVAPEEDYI
jgi:hypothetical protein